MAFRHSSSCCGSDLSDPRPSSTRISLLTQGNKGKYCDFFRGSRRAWHEANMRPGQPRMMLGLSSFACAMRLGQPRTTRCSTCHACDALFRIIFLDIFIFASIFLAVNYSNDVLPKCKYFGYRGGPKALSNSDSESQWQSSRRAAYRIMSTPKEVKQFLESLLLMHH